ncbi:MAG: CoA pyrophosphatase [Alphaproteobacteria bacterium]|nr:CoA pyrophosphatase [Alphaproteobacteria bacterium]
MLKRSAPQPLPCVGDDVAVPLRFAPANVFTHIRCRFTLEEPQPDSSDAKPGLCKAAVLVGLAAYHDEVRVILTQRKADLRVHAGQIAFPGGRIETADRNPAAAALRETQEEIGLEPEIVEPIGYLPSFMTGTGFRITPVIAKIETPLHLKPNPDEVAEVFEVPFAFLMDSTNHFVRQRMFEGKERQFYAIPYGERDIWGVTAGILRHLYERLYR